MEIIFSDEVKAYIKGLSNMTEKAQVAQYLNRQEALGHRIKEPVSKHLRDGINELRPGPHRLLFFYQKGQIVMVHVFRKKTRKTPSREVKTAIHKRSVWEQHE